MAVTAGSNLKIKAATAGEVCSGFTLSPEARQQLQPEMPPLDFVNALATHEIYSDAVQFLARALPKREAVWWSCLCARDLGADEKRPELAGGLEAAEAWVYRPTEETRRHAEKAGQAIKGSHPARWAAMAAFWSGGSLAPPGSPEAKPPEDFTAKAVAGAILLAAGLDPKLTKARNRKFLAAGIDIAKGGTGRPPTAG